MRRFLLSFAHAFDGIVAATREQPNLAVHEVLAVLALIAALALHLSAGGFVAILVLVALVLGLELMNTAIEAQVDLATLEIHPLAKRAKDAASGAVLVASAGAALAGIALFVDAALAPYAPPPVPRLDVQSAIAALGVTALLVVLLKVRFGAAVSGRAAPLWMLAALAALAARGGTGHALLDVLLALAVASSLSRRPLSLRAMLPGAAVGVAAACVCLLAHDPRML